MSKNSAADCPIFFRIFQQLREFKVSNELFTHRVVISLSCSSHIVTFAIHTFDLHILCVCVFRPNIGTWCKGTTFIGGTEKVVIAITCNLLATYLSITPCTFPLPRCSLFGKPVRISTVHNWSLRYAVFLAPYA